jgi:hypothetical protein
MKFPENPARSVQVALLICLCIFSLPGLGLVQTAQAAQVTLEWDPNSEPDLAGYKVYYGTESGAQLDSVDVGNATTYTVMGLLEETTYYFAATAYNTSNQESSYSNEVSTTTPSLCTYAISPASRTFTASGAKDTVKVTTSAGCPWTASSGISWVVIKSGGSGTGSGTVKYAVSRNTEGERLAGITIAGRIFTINQAAAAPPPLRSQPRQRH